MYNQHLNLGGDAWDDKLHEECGVFGLFNGGGLDTAGVAYAAMHAMQHRGQDGAGIAVSDGSEVDYVKNVGLLSEAIDAATIEAFNKKKIAIGHIRYATSSRAHTVINTQPLVMHGHDGFMALAHNGHVVNSGSVREELQAQGHLLQTHVDTEIFLHLIARESRGTTVEWGIESMMRQVRGSYAIVLMMKDKLYGMRDPWGIRPLSIGKLGNSYLLASESCAFGAVGAELVRDVLPGEIVIIDDKGLHSIQTPPKKTRSMCVFEYVYFARSDSVIDGSGVYGSRIRSGEALAGVDPVEADLVAGVPDSAIPAALGYARASGIQFGQALIKNPYSGRTFIQPGQRSRERSVLMKLSVVREQVEGKRIVLVDDSIVRGTNSLRIVDMLRQAGAKEVHMRIASPPVLCPCHFGINTPTASQLISAQNAVSTVCKMIGADSLAYLTIEGLKEAVHPGGQGLCTACFDGKYPMPIEDVSIYRT